MEKLTRILVALGALPVANPVAGMLELASGPVLAARLRLRVTVTC